MKQLLHRLAGFCQRHPVATFAAFAIYTFFFMPELLSADSTALVLLSIALFACLGALSFLSIKRLGEVVDGAFGGGTKMLAFAFIPLVIQGCSCTTVPQGSTGVIASLYGDEKGGIEEVGPGRYHYNMMNKELHLFPNYVQRVALTASADEGSPVDQSIAVMSRDQLRFSLDVGFSYSVSDSPGCASAMFVKYRKPVDEITSGPMRDAVRRSVQNVFSQYDASFIYGNGKPQVEAEVGDAFEAWASSVQSDSGTACVLLDNFAFLRLDPPQSVREAVERKIGAAQDAEREREKLQSIIYQSQQDSIKAVMDARNNIAVARSITPELLEWERLQVMREHWDGKLPQVMSGDGGGLLLGIDR